MTIEQLRSSARGSRILAIVFAIVIGVLFVIPTVAFATQGGNDARTSLNASKTSPSSTASPSPSASPEAEDCEAEYTQVASNNEGNQVIGDFEDRYATATAEANNMSDAQRTLMLEETGKSARVLAAWTHAFGLYEDPNAWKELVDGSCLSSEGMKLHNQLEGAVSAKGTTFEEAQAPADSFNSGVDNGVYGVSDSQGLYGDLKSIKVTLKDGTVVYILVRCGNPVYPGKPNLPSVPTDNPPPPVEPPPPVVEQKNINDAPQRQGNVPEQQKPNPLPAQPDHAQPNPPADPPPVYNPPPPPPPKVDPVGPVPPPKVDPKPPVITPPVAPAPDPTDPGTSTSCAPGQTTC